MIKALNRNPVATIIAVGSVIGGLIALATGSITYTEFQLGIGVSTAGAGVLGYARNGAGHGTGNQGE